MPMYMLIGKYYGLNVLFTLVQPCDITVTDFKNLKGKSWEDIVLVQHPFYLLRQ